MPEPSREADQSSGKPADPGQEEMRKQWGSLIAEPTAFLDLSQDFIDRLRAVAPKPRRPKIRYAAAIATVIVVIVVAVMSIHRSVVAMHRTAPPPSAPAVVAEAVTPERQTPRADTETPAAAEGTQASTAAALAAPPDPAAPPAPPSETTRPNELAPRAASLKNSRTPRKPHRRAPR